MNIAIATAIRVENRADRLAVDLLARFRAQECPFCGGKGHQLARCASKRAMTRHLNKLGLRRYWKVFLRRLFPRPHTPDVVIEQPPQVAVDQPRGFVVPDTELMQPLLGKRPDLLQTGDEAKPPSKRVLTGQNSPYGTPRRNRDRGEDGEDDPAPLA